MRKILLVVLTLGAARAFAVTQPVERSPLATMQNGRLRLTGPAADDAFASLPVDAEISADGGTVVKRMGGVTCTFHKSEDGGFCDIEINKEKAE